jgi:hypothetical protein
MRQLAPLLARTSTNSGELVECLTFIGSNDQFFLNIAMAMGKAIMDPVKGIAASTIVTAMSRNGTEFGIQVSGTGERWFTAPVEMPRVSFPGFSAADANPDIGDLAIVETIGLGGMADGRSARRRRLRRRRQRRRRAELYAAHVRDHCGRNADWTLPTLDFAGTRWASISARCWRRA